MMELKRWRAFHDVPLVLEPKHFPIDETPGTRLVFAAAAQGLDALRLSHEIGRALWVDDRNTADAVVLASACARAGIDAEALALHAPDAAELQRLWSAATAEAVSRGVFGAPSYVLESGEIFWGQDRLDFLDRALTA
jgi:2-hydroxychromene-2-carboxylate isomerase